jgi:hypothetical protein
MTQTFHAHSAVNQRFAQRITRGLPSQKQMPARASAIALDNATPVS